MNTTKNNKSIADFMDYEKQTWSYNSSVGYYTPFKKSSLLADKLKFHSNWKWLMEVVEKIEKLGFQVIISNNRCAIKDNGLINIDFNRTYCELTKMKAVYNACIGFIEWYNIQNKKQ